MSTPDQPPARNGERIIGAAPPGARDQASAAAAVREMFTSIAPRYDLLNHVLSMNVDRVWWNRTARLFSEVLHRPTRRCWTCAAARATWRSLYIAA